MVNDEFIHRLEKLSLAKTPDIKQTYEYGKAIRCINPEHEDKNPSMLIKNDMAICLSCGYTIPKEKEHKPHKSSLNDKVIADAIKLSQQEDISQFCSDRKYSPEVLTSLGIGKITMEVYNKLIVNWGMGNLIKSGLVKGKRFSFINKILIPITPIYFSVKPSVVSLKGKKIPYSIEGKEITIVCEDETDAIALHHIYPEYQILALRGVTSQAPLKEIITGKVWICFDNDKAGRESVHKASQMLIQKEVSLLSFDEKYKDIDELWKDKQEVSQAEITLQEYKTKDIFIDDDFEPITKPEYKTIIESNFPDLWETVDLCLSVISVNKLSKWNNPVNVNLVGPPSSQKTTVLSFFYDNPDIILKSDCFTPKSFVSHSVTVTKEELEDIDLLPKLRDKTFMTPELAPIFAKRKEDLTEVIGILTRVFDGEGLESDSGAQGHRGYTGEYLFSMLGATTPLSKTVWNIMGKMGSRMFFYYVPYESPEVDELINIVMDDKTFGDRLKECKAATKRMLLTIFKDGYKRNIEWDEKKNERGAAEVIAYCANILSRLRASLEAWEDEFSDNKEIIHKTPLIEVPYRIVSIFANIAKGHAITEGRNYITLDDVRIIPRITASTCPDDRLHAFWSLLDEIDNELTIKEVAYDMEVSEKVARKVVKELEYLKILNVEERMVEGEHNKTTKMFITFNEEVKEWIKKVDSTFPVSAKAKAQSTFYMPLKGVKKILDNIKSNKGGQHILAETGKVLEEESIEITPKQKIMNHLEGIDTSKYEDIQKATDIPELQLNSILAALKSSGEVFEPRIGYWKKLE